MLPDSIRAEVRAIVIAEVRMHAVPRAEHLALQAVVASMRCRLKAEDHAALQLLVPALIELRPNALMLAAEIVALAKSTPGPAGDALRRVMERFAGAEPGIALGKFMSRCAGWPVGGACIVTHPGDKKCKTAALYSLFGN